MDLEALIDARPTQRSQIRGWYSQLLAAADRSGLSIPDLAARLGCSRETVYSWRRRLRGEQATKKATADAQLVRVRVAEPCAAPSANRLEIRVGNGRSILVPATFEPATLATVVEVLEQC